MNVIVMIRKGLAAVLKLFAVGKIATNSPKTENSKIILNAYNKIDKLEERVTLLEFNVSMLQQLQASKDFRGAFYAGLPGHPKPGLPGGDV